MNCELEAQIGAKERAFDRARDRVDQLEVALRAAENALDREPHDFYRAKTIKQIKHIDADLSKARENLTAAKQDLEAAWALRNPSVEENRGEQ
jgi:multidrug resistance efflux pump